VIALPFIIAAVVHGARKERREGKANGTMVDKDEDS
jgi:hypothetical protein